VTKNFENLKLTGAWPGHPAPDFEARTLDGTEFKLSSLKGKVVFIDFWATWCAPCVAGIPELAKVHEKYGEEGLVVVSISVDSDAETARTFVRKKKLMTWTQIWAEGASEGKLASLYGVAGVPATFLIGPDGEVVARDLTGSKATRAIDEQMSKLRQERASAVEATAERR
jgi:thiol-disulfide isomerase/thioredoxin